MSHLFSFFSVPFKLRDKEEKEIDRLYAQGISIPAQNSKWSSPVAIVNKPSGDIRMCIVTKVTINPQIETEYYPLPRIDDLVASKGLRVAEPFT